MIDKTKPNCLVDHGDKPCPGYPDPVNKIQQCTCDYPEDANLKECVCHDPRKPHFWCPVHCATPVTEGVKEHEFVDCFGNHGDFCKTHGEHCKPLPSPSDMEEMFWIKWKNLLSNVVREEVVQETGEEWLQAIKKLVKAERESLKHSFIDMLKDEDQGIVAFNDWPEHIRIDIRNDLRQELREKIRKLT